MGFNYFVVQWNIGVAISADVSLCLLYMWHNHITVVSLHHCNTCSTWFLDYLLLYQNYSTTTLLTAKFRIRWYCFLPPPRKESWHEEPLKMKNNTFSSPFSTRRRKQMAITRPLFVLFKIYKCHFVQHVIPI